jgi:Trk K+ transport system NAD-binding subunit
MANPLLTFWHRMFVEAPQRRRPGYVSLVEEPAAASAPIFLVLRRMRAPLILLILIFGVSVLGLTLMPGTDASGQPHRLGFFDAFYFMSYTATTIGYGEIPYPFSVAQRMWVTFSIYLAVIGWAYAIGMMLALLQDHTFRQAVATERFRRAVARMPEPFLLLAGYGRTGQLVGRALDADGRRFVALDLDPDRIDALDLDALRADVPALPADARAPAHLVRAGLLHDRCVGALALTDDDEANLAVVMTVELLRPGLPVMARTSSAVVAERMHAFGDPVVVNPYDDFGDHLRVALRSPTVFQLRQWLTSPPGSLLPEAVEVPPQGSWVVVGDSPFSDEVVRDLRDDGLTVHVVVPGPDTAVDLPPGLGGAVGVVAATSSDTLNLAVVEQARRENPDVFVVAQQARPANRALYEASGANLVLVSAEVVAHEVLARIASPVLWQFLRDLSLLGDPVAGPLRDRLVATCGEQLPALWTVVLTGDGAPAVVPRLWSAPVRLGDLLRSPEQRDDSVAAVPLVLVREGQLHVLPEPDVELRLGDELLLAGRPAARRQLDTTLLDEATAAYALTGTEVPTTWIGRALSRA